MQQAAKPRVGELHVIAMIDANLHHQEEVSKALLSYYRVRGFNDANNALSALSLAVPRFVIVGETVPPRGGLHFVHSLRQVAVLSHTPVLFVANQSSRFGAADSRVVGADIHFAKPYRRSALIKAITSHLNAGVERQWESLPLLPRKALKGTMEAFNSISDLITVGAPLPYGPVCQACAPLIDVVRKRDYRTILNGVRDHDNYSFAHSLRVATLLSLFGEAAGLDDEARLLLAGAGLIHDVGKLSIPYDVLNKPGWLNASEVALMRSHVIETAKFLHRSPDVPKRVIAIAEQHHEKLDGSGYPRGLKGDQLNDLARMASVVDMFSAMTDRRAYKPAMGTDVALYAMAGMSEQLDQRFVSVFQTMLSEGVA